MKTLALLPHESSCPTLRAVLELRRVGRVAWDGTWAAAPLCGCGRAKVWRATR